MFHIFFQPEHQYGTHVDKSLGGNVPGSKHPAAWRAVSCSLTGRDMCFNMGRDATFRGIAYDFEVRATLERDAGVV